MRRQQRKPMNSCESFDYTRKTKQKKTGWFGGIQVMGSGSRFNVL